MTRLSSFIAPDVNTTSRFDYTATSGQTTFTGADDDGSVLLYQGGFIDVYLNGVRLIDGTDFTTTSDGESIVLTSPAASGDILSIVAYGVFDLANHYTKTESDNRYLRPDTVEPTFTGTAALGIPTGTTAERPASASQGQFRFNVNEQAFEGYDGSAWSSIGSGEKGTLTKTFVTGESANINLSDSVLVPVVSATKEVPQEDITNNDWDVASDGANYTLHDTAYGTTLTPSDATSNGTFTLGSGSFAAEDIGKRIVGNGGEAILTDVDGSYELQTNFNDTSTISDGDWSMFGLSVKSSEAGLEISNSTAGVVIDNVASWSFVGRTGASSPIGCFVSPDGSKLYISPYSSSIIDEYDLSPAYDVTTATYSGNSLTVESTRGAEAIYFRNDGLRLYVRDYNLSQIVQYNLTTPWNISTASLSHTYTDSFVQDASGIYLDPTGSLMFIGEENSQEIRQYNLTTPWELASATYSGISLTFASDNESFFFDYLGTSLYVLFDEDIIRKYNLSSPFNIENAQDSGESASFSALGRPNTFCFSREYMYIDAYNGNDITQYLINDDFLSIVYANTNHTAITSTSTDTEFWTDINSMTADDSANDGSIYYAVSTDDRTTWKIIDDTNGERNIVRNNGGTWEYNSDTTYGSETWVAATENDEFYAIEEATSVATNQMDATQLNAVSDANHYTLGNDLDLAITMFMADGGSASPTSDGVTINYDAQVKNVGAILGADYEWEAPTNSIVRITSLADQNLKVRVV